MEALAIIVPVLARPQNVEPLLESIEAATPPPYSVTFVCDLNDHEQIEAVIGTGTGIVLFDGSYSAKINVGIRETRGSLIFPAADDLHFHDGWLDAAKAQLGHQGAASEHPISFVGTQDLGHRRVKLGTHSTHPLVTREYVEQFGTMDEPGKLYHEGYHHNCCDIEAVETAKARRMWAFAHDAVVEHMHPSWGKGEMDATYRKGKERSKQDRALWEERRARLGELVDSSQ